MAGGGWGIHSSRHPEFGNPQWKAMQPPARVTALDLLRDFRAALAGFRAEAQDALAAVELDIRRAFDWLAERRQFWQRQGRELHDEGVRAKSELSPRQMVPPRERVPDCTQPNKRPQ